MSLLYLKLELTTGTSPVAASAYHMMRTLYRCICTLLIGILVLNDIVLAYFLTPIRPRDTPTAGYSPPRPPTPAPTTASARVLTPSLL